MKKVISGSVFFSTKTGESVVFKKQLFCCTEGAEQVQIYCFVVQSKYRAIVLLYRESRASTKQLFCCTEEAKQVQISCFVVQSKYKATVLLYRASTKQLFCCTEKAK